MKQLTILIEDDFEMSKELKDLEEGKRTLVTLAFNASNIQISSRIQDARTAHIQEVRINTFKIESINAQTDYRTKEPILMMTVRLKP